MLSDPFIRQLIKLIALFTIGGVAFCLVASLAFVKAGARGAWSACLLSAAILITALVARVTGVAQLDISLSLALYMSVAFIGTPLVFATLGIIRSGRREAMGGISRKMAFGFAVYLVGLFVGSVIAALPDAYDLFGR